MKTEIPFTISYMGETLSGMPDRIVSQSIEFIPNLLIATVIFLIFYLVAKIIQKIFFSIDSRMDQGRNHVLKLAGSVIKVAILTFGGITALGTMGLNVNALVAGLGLGGFALGFALKDALSNLLSGSLILIYQPFSCGDTITVAGCQGKVAEINLRYTILEGENKVFLIPNSSLFTNNIELLKKQ